jgi:hypothetical protein
MFGGMMQHPLGPDARQGKHMRAKTAGKAEAIPPLVALRSPDLLKNPADACAARR